MVCHAREDRLGNLQSSAEEWASNLAIVKRTVGLFEGIYSGAASEPGTLCFFE